MTDIVERLRTWSETAHDPGDDPHRLTDGDVQLYLEAAKEIERLTDRVDELADALQRIVSWSEAYPLDIFPEPDFKKAHEVLKAAGMTIDAISASAARFAIAGVGQIARSALESKS